MAAGCHETTSTIWITNDGLDGSRAVVSYGELLGMLLNMGCLAERILTLQSMDAILPISREARKVPIIGDCLNRGVHCGNLCSRSPKEPNEDQRISKSPVAHLITLKAPSCRLRPKVQFVKFSTRFLSITKASSKAALISVSDPVAFAGSGVLQCIFVGFP